MSNNTLKSKDPTVSIYDAFKIKAYEYFTYLLFRITLLLGSILMKELHDYTFFIYGKDYPNVVCDYECYFSYHPVNRHIYNNTL